jgi:hypothetical protein
VSLVTRPALPVRVHGQGRPPGQANDRGRLQQRSWTAEHGSARSTVEVVAEELGGEPALGDGNNDQDDEVLQLGPG